MEAQELKRTALEYLSARRNSDQKKVEELSSILSKIPYEDWQATRAIYPYRRKNSEDENYEFRNVSRFFEKEHVNKTQKTLIKELVHAKRMNLVFAVIGGALGFMAEKLTDNILRYACKFTEWSQALNWMRVAFCSS